MSTAFNLPLAYNSTKDNKILYSLFCLRRLQINLEIKVIKCNSYLLSHKCILQSRYLKLVVCLISLISFNALSTTQKLESASKIALRSTYFVF